MASTKWRLGIRCKATALATRTGSGRRILKEWAVLGVLAVGCASSFAGVTLTLEKRERISPTLFVKGVIEAGDADRVIASLKSSRVAPELVLDSPGGSIAEAVRIAQVVKKLVMGVTVAPGGHCASACFMIFAAGIPRHAASSLFMNAVERGKLDSLSMKITGKPADLPGFVGLHRPYQTNMSSPENSQVSVMKAVTSYLENEMVPRRLIDLMMTHSSSDIYWLNEDDLTQLAKYPPAVEEYLIQKCGYEPRLWDKVSENKRAGRTSEALLAKDEKARGCIVDELVNLRMRGLADLKSGWMPTRLF